MKIESRLVGERGRDRFNRIHDEIRSRICLLDYAPGTRLSEGTLAAEFGISRTPLRRVLSRLESDGLLRSVHGVGTFVTDADLEELAQTYRLRLELAELIGSLDPVAPTAALMAELAELSRQARILGGSPLPRRFAQLDKDFFLARLQLSANEPLRAISERLYFRTTRIWLKAVFAGRIDLTEAVGLLDREMDAVCRALQTGDVRSAALVHRVHLSMSFERLRSVDQGDRSGSIEPPAARG
jgi:DNA-binding GntR family transcriptional regulator